MSGSAKAAMGEEQGIHLWLLLWKATKAVEARARGSIRNTSLCLSDFGVLEALMHKGPLRLSALREKILLTSGSVTAAVDRLERRGWVERTLTPSDRRARVVRLTAEGSKLVRKLFVDHARDMEKAFSCLDRSDKKALAGLLRKFGRAIEAESIGKSQPDGKL